MEKTIISFPSPKRERLSADEKFPDENGEAKKDNMSSSSASDTDSEKETVLIEEIERDPSVPDVPPDEETGTEKAVRGRDLRVEHVTTTVEAHEITQGPAETPPEDKQMVSSSVVKDTRTTSEPATVFPKEAEQVKQNLEQASGTASAVVGDSAEVSEATIGPAATATVTTITTTLEKTRVDEGAEGEKKDPREASNIVEEKVSKTVVSTTVTPAAPAAAAPPREKLTPAHFLFGQTLGEGAYARVVHAKMKSTGREYAIKIMEKRFIKKENKVKFVMMERSTLARLNHEKIIKLYFTFQDRSYLYLVMELCQGGELLKVVNHFHEEEFQEGVIDKACPLPIAQFYIAEVVQALMYLHSQGIIHRDLKPENILLSKSGHIKITDFGTAKNDNDPEARANTFCGTAEYVSPEVLRDEDAGKACDLWALGCMIFQLLVGRPPFRGDNEYLTFQQILNHPSEDFNYPETIPAVARDLIEKLLVQDPNARLGAGSDEGDNGYKALCAHPFFEPIDWVNLAKSPAPYTPSVSDLAPITADGASEDWLLAGVATELQVSPVSARQIMREGSLPRTRPSEEDSVWKKFLRDGEKIIFSALVGKRRGLFSKQRQLILTSTPRIIYADPDSMKLKGEIPWSSNIYVQIKNSSTFDIVTVRGVQGLPKTRAGSGDFLVATLSTSFVTHGELTPVPLAAQEVLSH